MITILTDIFATMSVDGKPIPELSVGQQSWLNAIGDNAKYPLPHLDTPLVADLDLQLSGGVARAYPVKIFFMWKSQPDWTPKQHNELAIKPARLAITQFIARLESSPLIDSIKNAKELEFMNLFDVNTSGIILSITIKPRNTDPVCIS